MKKNIYYTCTFEVDQQCTTDTVCSIGRLISKVATYLITIARVCPQVPVTLMKVNIKGYLHHSFLCTHLFIRIEPSIEHCVYIN